MAWVKWDQRRFAPDLGTPLCRDDELSDGVAREFTFGEGKRPFSMFLHRHGGVVRAWVNACPHFQLPLNAQPDRFLNKDATKLTCAHHYARFDPISGDCVEGPCTGDKLLSIPVSLVDELWVVG